MERRRPRRRFAVGGGWRPALMGRRPRATGIGRTTSGGTRPWDKVARTMTCQMRVAIATRIWQVRPGPGWPRIRLGRRRNPGSQTEVSARLSCGFP
jgi:hypothetical protein